MKQQPKPIFLVCSLLFATHAAAQFGVEVLDFTPHAYSYEPALVVFEVRNEGSAGVAIPADGCSGGGAFLEIGPVGQPLYDPFPVYDCRPDRLVWLEPGERWLFLQSASPGAKGEFHFQAVLRSRGTCGGRPTGPHRHRMRELDQDDRSAHAQYECWNGEARSQLVTVVVDVPDAEADLAAAAYLNIEDGQLQGNSKLLLLAHSRQLFEKFPTSHYTYAAFRGGGDFAAMLNVVIAQPDNPLNPWVAGAMAASLARRDRPCAPPYKERPGAPPDLAERYQRVIAAYPPPKAVQDFLRQQAREFAAEECPEAVGGAQ